MRFAKLQRRFQRVLAENVRHQVGASALGLALDRVDAKVARGISGSRICLMQTMMFMRECSPHSTPSSPPATTLTISSITCSLDSRPFAAKPARQPQQRAKQAESGDGRVDVAQLSFGSQRFERVADEIEIDPFAIENLFAMLWL